MRGVCEDGEIVILRSARRTWNKAGLPGDAVAPENIEVSISIFSLTKRSGKRTISIGDKKTRRFALKCRSLSDTPS